MIIRDILCTDCKSAPSGEKWSRNGSIHTFELLRSICRMKKMKNKLMKNKEKIKVVFVFVILMLLKFILEKNFSNTNDICNIIGSTSDFINLFLIFNMILWGIDVKVKSNLFINISLFSTVIVSVFYIYCLF